MDVVELSFAKQMQDSVIAELEAGFPQQMAGVGRANWIKDHFEGYLYAQLEELEKIAKLIRAA